MLIKNLTKHKYKGLHQTKKPNEITKLIYRAKFLQEAPAIYEMTNILFNIIETVNFEVIVPVRTTHSKVSLPETLAKLLAEKTETKFLKTGLKDKNKTASPQLKNKAVLILDDVTYSGKTMRKAISAVKKTKPSKIFFLAIAKS